MGDAPPPTSSSSASAILPSVPAIASGSSEGSGCFRRRCEAFSATPLGGFLRFLNCTAAGAAAAAASGGGGSEASAAKTRMMKQNNNNKNGEIFKRRNRYQHGVDTHG